MIITRTHHPVVHIAAPKSITQDPTSQDPYATTAAATSSALSSVASTSTDSDSSDQEQAYEEAFARMQVQMQTATTSASSTSADSTSGISSVSGSTDSVAATDTSSITPTQKEFMDYMQESPAQQAQDSTLQEMGLTQETFDKLPAEQKDAIQKEIAQRVKDESQDSGTQSAEASSVTATAA